MNSSQQETSQAEAPDDRSSSRLRRVLLFGLGLLVIPIMGGMLAIALLVITRSEETPAVDAPPTSSINRIVLIDSDGRLATVDPDGANERVLADDRQYQYPAWSPTGDLVAAIGRDEVGGGLYVGSDATNSQLRELYYHPQSAPVYLYWSPEGANVSFIASSENGLRLHVVPPDGSEDSRMIATGRTSFFWKWFPDGERVLIHTGFTGEDGANTSFVQLPIARENGEHERIAIPEEGKFQAPAISGDGKYYSFARQDELGNRWLLIHETDGGKSTWLQPHEGVVAMAWNPATPQLAYISPEQNQRNSYGPLKLIDLEEKKYEVLIDDVILAFVWSPDGQKIAYFTLNNLEQREGGLNIVFLDLKVFDMASGEATLLATFQPSDGFVNQFLSFFDNYGVSHAIWSPDSRNVVIPRVTAGGEEQILVVPIDGSGLRTVAEGVIGFWSRR